MVTRLKRFLVLVCIAISIALLPAALLGQGSSPNVVGQWSSVITWPLVAVHATLLPTREVLMWDAWEFNGTPSGRRWNPSSQLFTDAPVPNSALFCAGHATLGDGRTFVIGGHHGGGIGIVDANIFDHATSTWIPAATMSAARWYPTAVTLADGRVLALGGEITPDVFANVPEVYDPATNDWTALSGATLELREYPRAVLAPDGRVFVVAGIDQKSRFLNVATQTWSLLDTAPVSSGTGVMYRPGLYVVSGGGTNNSDPVQAGTAVIDLNQSSPTWRVTSPMQFARVQHNLVMLPDGKMLAVGGSPELSLISTQSVLPTEMWDPTNETWSPMAPVSVPRLYHSFALLLPDGRVLSAGGGRIDPAPDYPSAQIYSPPYLFKGAQPTITNAPGFASWGGSMTVTTPDAASIASVSLIHLASVTHTLDTDQRFIPLSFTTGANQLTVQAPANATVAPPGYYMLFIVNSTGVPSTAAMVRIGNNAPPPTISIGDVTVTEGNVGSLNAVFNVTLSNSSTNPVTAQFATANGTAIVGSDYTAANGTVTFPSGSTSQQVSVAIIGDTNAESTEGFFVNLSNPTNATILDGQGAGTILDNDVPVITINDVSVAEGNAGPTAATFTVSLSAASGQTVSVNYATAPGTATAGSDYVTTSGTLSFTPGITTRPITVTVNGDTLNEPNETFVVNLTAPVNATISDSQGTGTITSDDVGLPSLSINDVSVIEGNAGSKASIFTVSLSGASSQTVSVNYATAPGTATPASDYVTSSGALSFAPGIMSRTLTVMVKGDTLNEANEQFLVNLSGPVNATPNDTQGVGTIVNDDPLPALTINNLTFIEKNSGSSAANLTVTLSPVSGRTVTVAYATANGTASAASDYATSSGTITFPAGTTTQLVPISILSDLLDESNETVFVNLSGPQNATIADSQGQITIVDDDARPSLRIDDVTLVEGNSGTINAVFTVLMSAPSGRTVTVHYATANVSAGSNDYVAAAGTLTFNPGITSQTIAVQVKGDTLHEANETFVVNLSAAVQATLADAQGKCTITDNDP